MKHRQNKAVTAFCTLVPNAAFLSAALNTHFQKCNLPISAIASLPHPSFAAVNLIPAIESDDSSQLSLLVESDTPDLVIAQSLLNPDFYKSLEPQLMACESGFLPMECLMTAFICHSITVEYLKHSNAPAAILNSAKAAQRKYAWFDACAGASPLQETVDSFVDTLIARGPRGMRPSNSKSCK